MKEKKFKVQPFVSNVMASISWDSRNVSGILEQKCHNPFRAVHTDKQVQTTNLKISAKLEDKSSPHPPHLRPSDFHLFGSLKDALRGSSGRA
jgi:hypothetical protein